MGKKGKLPLTLPKGDGRKTIFDGVIQCIYEAGGVIETREFLDRFGIFLKDTMGGRFDTTTLYQKAVMPRYFGLATLKESKYELTEFGEDYAAAQNDVERLDVICRAMADRNFGRDNEAVSSNSNVQAPVVFLRLINDLGRLSLTQLGCALYGLDADGISYRAMLKKMRSKKDWTQEKSRVIALGGRKLFDPKFHIFFTELGMVDKAGDDFVLPAQVSARYGRDLAEISPVCKPAAGRGEGGVRPIAKLEKAVDLTVNSFLRMSKLPDPEIAVLKKRMHPRAGGGSGGGRAIKAVELSESCRLRLGWSGEKYVYDLLKRGSAVIMDAFNFSPGETIEKIEWFNHDWKPHILEDRSRGRGCDLRLITTSREIQVEVKTSFNEVSYFSVTGGELRAMAAGGDGYFLVKIDSFKRIVLGGRSPKITVVGNPIAKLWRLAAIKSATVYFEDLAVPGP